ncbi:Hypothetical predicted protein [Olea europaea subsp. europaea]|uniref:DUF1985 domain-containing protein n=1 Tax=Olea europaea subsp. europaea TaxID=158383 RepID=A0A8S0R3Y9_OLEEU|nr:Hypothetical predicted protein [Olea europaea subsp. europaea]
MDSMMLEAWTKITADAMKSHIKKSFKRHLETINTELSSEKTPIDNGYKTQAEPVAIESSSTKKKLCLFVNARHVTLSEFYIPKENRFGESINMLFKKNVISKLNNKMNATQKELFKRTCFGQFFEMREMRLRHQVIHKFLLMEVRQSTHVEMWFKVAGKHLMFSVEEFALASGLACQGDDNTNVFKIGHSRIKHLLFKHKKNVYMKDVENTFNNLTAATSDEDVVRLGALYLISSFPYTTTSANVVPHEYFRNYKSPYPYIFAGKGIVPNYIHHTLIRFYLKWMSCEVPTYQRGTKGCLLPRVTTKGAHYNAINTCCRG